MRRSSPSSDHMLATFTQRMKKCLSTVSAKKAGITNDRMATTAFKNCCRAVFDKQVVLLKVDLILSNFTRDESCSAIRRLQHLFHLSLDGQSASCALELFNRMCRLRSVEPDADGFAPFNPADLGQLCFLVVRAKSKSADGIYAQPLRIADLETKCRVLVLELKLHVFVGSWYELWDLRLDLTDLVRVLQLLLAMQETETMDNIIMDISHMLEGHAKTKLWNILLNANGNNIGAEAAEEIMKRMVAMGVKGNVVTWNTLMNAYAAGGNAGKCEELMKTMQAPPHCIAPNVTTWNTLMNAYFQRSKLNMLKCGGDDSFSVFQRFLSARLVPNSHTLSTLFSALLYGLGGDRRAGPLKVIELSKRWVNSTTLNHYVAAPVLRALAEAGTAADLDKFWAFCSAHLGGSRHRWPGPSFRILSDLSQRHSGTGQWSRVAALLASSAASQAPSRP
jgi:pentatricopeptide repeat protein